MLLKLAPVLLLVCPAAFAQRSGVPSRESLEYSVEWRLITAGRAKLDWTQRPGQQGGYEAKLHLESSGLVSKLFRVQDDYSALFSSDVCIQSSYLSALEGSRNRETRITFDSEAKKASYLERDRAKNTVVTQQETEIPACTHDVLGGLFVMRMLNLEPGQSTQVPVTDGKKSVVARVEAQQREEVKVAAGTFKTVRYEIFLFNNVLYRRPAHLYVWLTDDRRKLPVQVRVRMQFTIGTITLMLTKYDQMPASSQ